MVVVMWLLVYAFLGGCFFSVYARLEQSRLRHPIWVVFLTVFLCPAVLSGLGVLAVAVVGMGLSQRLLDAAVPPKTVK